MIIFGYLFLVVAFINGIYAPTYGHDDHPVRRVILQVVGVRDDVTRPSARGTETILTS